MGGAVTEMGEHVNGAEATALLDEGDALHGAATGAEWTPNTARFVRWVLDRWPELVRVLRDAETVRGQERDRVLRAAATVRERELACSLDGIWMPSAQYVAAVEAELERQGSRA